MLSHPVIQAAHTDVDLCAYKLLIIEKMLNMRDASITSSVAKCRL